MTHDPAEPDSGPEQTSSTLTAKTLHGIKWTYLATVASAGMQLVFAAVMARLLSPAAFGLVAMTQLVLTFSDYFAKMGIGPALIQKADLTELEVRAGWTSTAALGALSSAAVFAFAPLAGDVFNEPDVIPVLQLMAFTLFLSGLGMTSQSVLHRTLRFRENSVIEVISYAIGYFAVGLTLAMLGAGVWSLVAAALAQQLIRSVLLYWRVRHPLRPTFRADAYRPLYSFGGQISVLSLLQYIGQNLDIFMVGRYLPAAALGQYSRGNLLVQVPLYQLMSSFSEVLFPSFSQIQHETERIRFAYLNAVGLAAAVLLPMCFGMAVASREIVLVILGDQWLPVITILPILAFNGSFLVLTHFAGVVTEARAELGKNILLQCGYLVVLLLLLIPVIGSDLRAYALVFAAGSLLQHLAYMYLMNRILGVTLRDYGRVYTRAMLTALMTAAIVWMGRFAAIFMGAPLVAVLAIEVALGVFSLGLAFRIGPARRFGLELLQRLNVDATSGRIERALRTLLGATRS